ncbi:MAG TPA: sigma-70 family RNA polymerase sigma factor [Intrasporangium sp.]|nr:sigma-70 family RNA polymerase sigma factor [Intrasporangium sp.]
MSLGARDGAPVDAPVRAEDDEDLQDWVALLRTPGPDQAAALTQLHRLMLRAAGHQVWRMRSQLGGVGREAIDVLINQSADEAMTAVLAKLDTFEGRSRFTTWAYKFAILQAASDVRRAAWRDREVALHDIGPIRDTGVSPAEHVEAADLASALTAAMATALTPHQRRITVALLVDLVPVDVLAERLGTNRNALYKTLHDARARLRDRLVMTGHLPTPTARPNLDGGHR